jgi:hypothetical protein
MGGEAGGQLKGRHKCIDRAEDRLLSRERLLPSHTFAFAGPAMLIDPSTGLPYQAPQGAVIVPAGQPMPQAPQMVAQEVPAAAPAAVGLPPNLAPQQAQVLQQVLSLTPAQIEALPPAQRQQVLLVRQQLGLPPLAT